MSVLSKPVILRELKKGKGGDGLVVSPLDFDQIGPASIDLSLGNEFIVFKRASISCTDIMDGRRKGEASGEARQEEARENNGTNLHRLQEKKRIGNGARFILHPGQLVLGATREYVALSDNISAHIVGRSSWGRTGLIIATATYIQPGFKGCVTLELVNEGEIPLALYPGLRVAQLVLSFTEEACDIEEGRYQYQTGPKFPLLKKEGEYLDFLGA